MERLDAFEAMHADIQKQAHYEEEQMAQLKASGKEKSATFRQYFGNHLIYSQIFSYYKKYGLLD